MDILNTVLAIDFQKILLFVGLYLATLWVLICLWVYMDARKRYKSKQLGIIFFLLVFILNFPALLFYIIIRPEVEDEHVFFMHSEDSTQDLGGVNVPIVNFIGEDGFKISLQLKVANPKAEKDSNLNIDLDWKSNDENMVVKEKTPEVKLAEVVEVKEVKPSIGSKFGNVKSAAKNKINGAKTKVTLSMKKFSRKKEGKKNEEIKELLPKADQPVAEKNEGSEEKRKENREEVPAESTPVEKKNESSIEKEEVTVNESASDDKTIEEKGTEG
ncbi:MAG: hypothetical protein ABI721_02170 [Candidatus Dojkabacteria bacterium]